MRRSHCIYCTHHPIRKKERDPATDFKFGLYFVSVISIDIYRDVFLGRVTCAAPCHIKGCSILVWTLCCGIQVQ